MPWHLAIVILGWSHTLAVVWYVTYFCLVRALSSPISYRVVLVTAYFSVVWLSSPWCGLFHTCIPHGSTHLFGHLCSLSFPRARRDM